MSSPTTLQLFLPNSIPGTVICVAEAPIPLVAYTLNAGRTRGGPSHNHVAIDRWHGLIRGWTARHAAAHDGARLAEVVDTDNTAGDVWADTAYRSAKNEAWLADRGLVSRIRRKKPPGRLMLVRTRQANARKSAVRSAVEHVFARQKGPMALMVRTIGIARARVKIGLANLVHNIKRLVWLSGRPAPA